LDLLGLDACSSASNRLAATSYTLSQGSQRQRYCDGIKEMPYRWVCFEQTSKLEENYSAFFEAFSFESQSSGRGEKKFDAF